MNGIEGIAGISPSPGLIGLVLGVVYALLLTAPVFWFVNRFKKHEYLNWICVLFFIGCMTCQLYLNRKEIPKDEWIDLYGWSYGRAEKEEVLQQKVEKFLKFAVAEYFEPQLGKKEFKYGETFTFKMKVAKINPLFSINGTGTQKDKYYRWLVGKLADSSDGKELNILINLREDLSPKVGEVVEIQFYCVERSFGDGYLCGKVINKE